MITLTRADSPEINLRAVEAATARLAEAVRDGADCRWCAARALLTELEDYARSGRCPHGRAVRGLMRSARAHLADEPRVKTRCRACLRLRRLAAGGEGSACPVHATCRDCRVGPRVGH